MTYKLVRNLAVFTALTLAATSVVADDGGPVEIQEEDEPMVIRECCGEDRLSENVNLNGGGGKVAVQDLSLRDPQVLTGLGFFAFIAALSAASGSK